MNQPEQYSKNNWFQSEETSRLLDKYVDPEIWKRAESILEIGAGDGKYTVDDFLPRLPENLQRYVAIDISNEMVEFAQKKYSKEKYNKIEFMTMDCQTENIAACLINNFDFVVSFISFHWFTNVRKAIENIFITLKPGGELIATFFETNPLDDVFFNLSKHPRWGAYGHGKYVSDFFTSSNHEKSWKDVFTKAGFVINKYICESKKVEFHDEFEDFFKSLDPIFVKIPDVNKEAYLNDYFQEMQKGQAFSITKMKKSENKILFSFDIVFIQAMKLSN